VYVIAPAHGLGLLRAPAMLGASLVLTLISAHLFHRVAEVPFHKLSQRHGARPNQQAEYARNA
jgi:peptidoglycan/LPS O-acetylase OafA/YrhL